MVISQWLKPAAKWLLRRTLYRSAVYLPEASDRPFLIRLDINDTCNLRCKKCFYPAYRACGDGGHQMSFEEFRLVAARLFYHTYAMQLGCSFEALTHPRLPEIVAELDRYDIPNVGMVTNGTLLSGERARAIAQSRSIKDLSVSLNALRPATYEALHGRPLLERVLKNIEDFVALRNAAGGPPPHLKINTVLMRTNLGEIEDLLSWCQSHGVEELQIVHVEPMEPGNDESLLAEPAAYNAAHARLRAQAAGGPTLLLLPPPMLPEYRDPATGLYRWLHGTDSLPRDEGIPVVSHEGDAAGPATAQLPPHPYPHGVHCICPWMTLMIDCRGNLNSCSHRMQQPFANILRQEREEALNSIKILRLRRAMLRGRHGEVCPFCHTGQPYGDPMRCRISHLRVPEGSPHAVGRGDVP